MVSFADKRFILLPSKKKHLDVCNKPPITDHIKRVLGRVSPGDLALVIFFPLQLFLPFTLFALSFSLLSFFFFFSLT